MSKQFLAVIAIIIVIFGGVLIISGNKDAKTTKSSGNPGTLTQHIEGKGSTGVTLVEYGDYECPFCEEYYTTVKAVETEFDSQITFQFRNFPLVSIHPNAFAGARAAEAASLQGQFWPMHDTLYDNSNWQVWSTASNPTPDFYQYAQELGLNVTQFKADFASSKVNDLVNADMAEGNKLGITGTPTFYLDGKQIQPANNLAAFETPIKAAIAAKASTAKTQ